MAVSDMINLSGLLDEARCFDLVRQHRWPDGVPVLTAPVLWSSATAMTTGRGIASAICAMRVMPVSTT
jgi:hypothetical protein